jgi:hypothetical protein
VCTSDPPGFDSYWRWMSLDFFFSNISALVVTD